MFQQILLAYDGSAHSKRAAEFTADIAVHRHALVRIVTAFRPISRVMGNPELEQAMQRETSEANATALEAATILRAAGLDPHIEVLEGPPADAILRVAEVRNSELIVMGSRGLGNAAALFLGSVSNKVLQEAKCPVLVVK